MSIEQQTRSLVAKRKMIFSNLTELCDFFRKIDPTQTSIVHAKYQRLDHLEQEFERVQGLIFDLNSQIMDEKNQVPFMKESKAILDLIDTIRAAYFQFKKDSDSDHKMASTTSSAPTSSFLPALQITTFDGNIDKWIDFITLYDSLVHQNASLSNIQKFHYLRSNLRGEPLSTISSFAIDDVNYTLAYDALKNRYQNNRRLANYYLQQILHFKSGSNTTSQHFLDSHENAYNALVNLQLTDLADYILFQLSYNNLDSQSQRSFDLKQNLSEIPKFEELVKFVKLLAKTDELKRDTLPQLTSNSKTVSSPSYVLRKPKVMRSLICNTNTKPKQYNKSVCPACQNDHKLFQCEVFKQKSLEERYEMVKQHQLCFNCLGSHFRKECSSRSSCKVCGSRFHHTFLHKDKCGVGETPVEVVVQSAAAAADMDNKQQTSVTCNFSNYRAGNTVMLGTIQAYIVDAYDRLHTVRVVTDTGSQVSVVTNDCVQRLGFKPNRIKTEVNGISSTPARSSGSVNVVLCSRLDTSQRLCVNAIVLDKISNNLPSTSFSTSLYQQFQHLSLADPSFHCSSSVDMLLGADVYCQLLSNDSNNFIQGEPSAIKTIFGWLIMGSCPSKYSPTSATSLFMLSPSLEECLKSFWESEEGVSREVVNPSDEQVEQHFRTTTYRNEDGRYVVSLPFNNVSATPLQSNVFNAWSSYHRLEKRLMNQPQLKQACNEFLQEYIDLGHMEPASQPARYILPYHCVSKLSSSTTKVRVVFNASAPDSSGVSLNERLLPGPKLQKDVTHILTAFRLHEVALCADIKMMYRQILLNPNDRIYQHILWRPASGQQVQEYQLNTVTYGLVPSAFQAQRVLLQLTQDEGQQYPAAAAAIRNQTYVDDIVTGADSVDSALSLYQQLTDLLKSGGFELRKWSCSQPQVLSNIPAEHRQQPLVFSTEDAGIKILGLMWDARSDVFRYHAEPFAAIPTKRSILSYIARIFDPMGWLAPVVFWVKQFLQRLWACKLDWDSPMSPDLLHDWSSFVADFHQIQKIEIPRKITSIYCSLCLVGFCDASEKGFAAVVYVHCTLSSGLCSSHLLKSRSKVAPLKPLTIPRLELNGAVLLSNLLQSVLPHLVKDNQVYLFTDSTIVLSWIKTEAHLLKTYVANRVCQVQSLTRQFDWRHVNTEDNPADVASRGLSPARLVDCSLWWSGPDFLNHPPHSWPQAGPVVDVDQELKTQVVMTAITNDENDLFNLLTKYSSLTRLVRVTAYLLRFISRCKGVKLQTSTLTVSELNSSMLTLVRLSQLQDFSQVLQSNNLSPSLSKLNPFVDSCGLIRVGGRLRHSSLPQDTKHPLLLSSTSHLSRLICDFSHVQHMHAGPRTLQSIIQKKYWILSLRSLLRKRIHSCSRCFRLGARPIQQRMGDLPPARVQVSRPFSSVGVDYAGPFEVKQSSLRKCRTSKGYMCIFICTAVKAVHIEMVSDMTTDAFLAAFDRFTSRRGLPTDVFSDCGRNFIGANNQLKQISDFLRQQEDEIHSALVSRSVNWHFNPPHAPNFGGLWEAAVKSAKSLLHKSFGTTSMTFEEYATIFSRIEAVLNSRPLTGSSPDPSDGVNYLTPGHFLIGTSLVSSPEYPVDYNINLRCRWQRLRQTSQFFWHRWSTEYLHTLMQRNKWTKASANINVGQLVYFTNVNTSPLCWPIGIIEKLHPGPDGLVRVVSVRTTGGTFVRPLNKLIVMSADQ